MLNTCAYEFIGLEPFALSDAAKRRYRKQLAYTGNFVKKQKGSPEIKFSIDDASIQHWHGTYQQFADDGVEVPMPLGHTEDAEKRRGTLVGTEIGKDHKGRTSLYGLVEFRDEQAERDLRASNVSVYVPSEFTSGNGKTYKWPIRHVAFTDYPVLPGLAPFESIAASFEEDLILGNEPMALQNIAAALGIPNTTPPEQLEATIMAKIQALMGAAKPVVPGAPPVAGPPRPAFAAGFIKMAKENREQKLAKLVEKNHITKAVADDLAKQYCTDDGLALALSTEDGKPPPDNFEALLLSLAKNEPFKTGEHSGHQRVPKDGETNPLVENAKKRAKAATERNGR